MANGLSVSGVANVEIAIAPIAAGQRNFGAKFILGSSPIIDVAERIRPYSALEAIATDFGTTAPEYKAAATFFSQSPQPSFAYVGRWAQTATHAVLHGAVLSSAQQQMSGFTTVSNGSFQITLDGTLRSVTGLNFSSATNLNGVAAIVQAALPSGATFTWDAVLKRFSLVSGTTGASSTSTYGGPAGAGTDVSTLLGLTQASGASAPVNGIAAESLASCVASLIDQSSAWYGLSIAALTTPSDADIIAVAALIEGASQARIFGVTITSSNVLDPTQTGDLASQLQDLGYSRTVAQYSSSNPYAVASLLGRAFTVDFTAQNTTITLKFKQEPGVVAENITESQAATLKSKSCNVFVQYNNSTAIIQEGVMANGWFFDERHGLDWFQNALQTALYNVLYTSTTKVPQTDDGVHLLVAAANKVCDAAVNNGLIAPGIWNGTAFGTIKTGSPLTTGYYVYAPLVATQLQADREARKAPTLQIALKGAGAIHFADVICTFNR